MTRFTNSSRFLFGAFLALILNSAYVAAFADPTLWYFVQVAVHPLLGLALAAWIVFLLVKRQWTTGWFGMSSLAVSAIGLALGLAVLALGATTPYRALVSAHVLISAAGAALLVVNFWFAAPRLGSRRMAWAIDDSLVAALLGVAALTVVGRSRAADWRRMHLIQNPATTPTTMEAEEAARRAPYQENMQRIEAAKRNVERHPFATTLREDVRVI